MSAWIPGPCPFCGSRQTATQRLELEELGREVFYVSCAVCDAMGPGAVREETAVRVWSSRPSAPLDTFESDGWEPQRQPVSEERVRDAAPCPFCGHDLPWLSDDPDSRGSLLCGACGARGPEGGNREEAIQVWDRRP